MWKLAQQWSEPCDISPSDISPSNNLHSYLVNHPELKISLLIGILRSHCKKGDSTSTFTEHSYIH